MMKNRNTRVALIAVLLLIFTAVIAAIHLSTRDTVPENVIIIERDSSEMAVTLEGLQFQRVTGDMLDAKGEDHHFDGQGISVCQILIENGVDLSTVEYVSVVARDEYKAELTQEDILREDDVWLLVQDDGSLRLVVFSDTNRKRNVSRVERLIIE